MIDFLRKSSRKSSLREDLICQVLDGRGLNHPTYFEASAQVAKFPIPPCLARRIDDIVAGNGKSLGDDWEFVAAATQ
jgi:hypothetical protein